MVSGAWSVRARSQSLQLLDDFPFTKLTVVENYNQPDTCLIEGPLDWVRVGMGPGLGAVVLDDKGVQRFSGQLNLQERRGDRKGSLPYHGDLTRLWWRLCYPTPTAAWGSQTTGYDVQTGSAEARILGYVNRNCGPGALPARRAGRNAYLRLPVSQNRGPVALTSARFQILGQLVATLAESAGLRVRIVHANDPDGSPHLDLRLDPAPNLSAWARFGTAWDSGPGMLGEGWVYRSGMPDGTALLAAAGGNLENRQLQELDRTSAPEAAPWGERIEKLVDMRGTTDTGEITAGLKTAWLESSGLREIEAPVVAGDLDLGTEVPVGAVVAAAADGQPLIERMRRLTTTVATSDQGRTVTVEPVFGSPDAPLRTPDQRRLAAMFRRIQTFERT